MRFDVDSFREIADSLVRNRSRSLLTGFGVFWGVFMLLFMLGGGEGLKQVITANFEGFATNTCIMVSSQTSEPYKGFKEGRYWNLTYTDVERLRRMMPDLETVTPRPHRHPRAPPRHADHRRLGQRDHEGYQHGKRQRQGRPGGLLQD